MSGHEGRVNDVIFVPASCRPLAPQALLFFGGDVQDYPEAMEAHRENRNYLEWNLENTAKMLALTFPEKHIVVVRPSRIECRSFSCYDNFVPSNNAGVPDHTPTHCALHHMQGLLRTLTHRLKALTVNELFDVTITIPEDIDIEDLHNSTIHKATGSRPKPEPHEASVVVNTQPPIWWHDRLCLDQSELSLVGFSKGCVVLNQLVYEFHYTQTLTPGDERMMRFISRIESMYWLDGGHAGAKNTWITSRSLLETLTRLNIKIHIHVSPYQVQDESRPWIGREERTFTNLLRILGAKVVRHLHATGSIAQPSLTMHFGVLANFTRSHFPPSPSTSTSCGTSGTSGSTPPQEDEEAE